MPRWRTLFIIAALLLGGCAHPAATQITAAPSDVPEPIESPYVTETLPAALNTKPQITFMTWGGTSLNALCELEANRERPSGVYGETVEIVSEKENGLESCLVRPTDGRKGPVALITWLGQPEQGANVAIIRAETEQEAVDTSAQQSTFTQPQPTLIPCEFNQGEISPVLQSAGPTTVEEYPLAHPTGCSPLNQPQEFYELIQQVLPGQPDEQSGSNGSLKERLKPLNERLKPFGYSIKSYGDGFFQIMKDGNLLRANISWLGQLTLSADGTRFLLPVLDSYNSASFLLRENGLEEAAGIDLLVYDNVYPVITQQGEVKLEYDTQTIPRAPGQPALLNVFIESTLADRLSITGSTSAGGPVRGLWAVNDGYVIEVSGMVLKNREILNDTFDCDEIFGWQIFSGEEFFYCQREGEVRAYLDNQPTSLVYDEVIRGPLPGSAMLVQMRRSNDTSAFFARRGEEWMYVVVRSD